jgi:hypothetical protein
MFVYVCMCVVVCVYASPHAFPPTPPTTTIMTGGRARAGGHRAHVRRAGPEGAGGGECGRVVPGGAAALWAQGIYIMCMCCGVRGVT